MTTYIHQLMVNTNYPKEVESFFASKLGWAKVHETDEAGWFRLEASLMLDNADDQALIGEMMSLTVEMRFGDNYTIKPMVNKFRVNK